MGYIIYKISSYMIGHSETCILHACWIQGMMSSPKRDEVCMKL